MSTPSIRFKSLSRPRRAAKVLCELIPGLKLAEAQCAVARMCGYDDWAQLKQAAEHPNAVASPDDEDLATEALQARLDFQKQQVRAVFNNTLKQASEIVRRASPTRRSPAPAQPEPAIARQPLRGANVYMPSPFTRFAPSYPEVFGFLPDVVRLRVDFIQPGEHTMLTEHLADEVTFTFVHGKKLALKGVYFWKFLDSIPSELVDERGEFLHPNPYSVEPVEDMLARLRGAYDFLFATGKNEHLQEPPPLWVELDLVNGTLTRRNPIGLQDGTKEALWTIFNRVIEDSAVKLQPIVDAFMVQALTSPRVELKFVSKGKRGSGVFGNEYVRSSWAGTGHWTMKDLLHEMSSEQLHPSGCGGNLRYGELFDRLVQPHFAAALHTTCLEVVDTPTLYKEVHAQLELPPIKGRATRDRRANQLVDGIVATNWRLDLAYAFSQALVTRQGDRTFSSWHSSLEVDESLKRPTVRLDELINSYRTKAESA